MRPTTGWEKLRRLARRRSRRRILSVLVFLPAAVILLILDIYDAWSPETLGLSGGIIEAAYVWPLRICGGVFFLGLIVGVIGGALGDLRGVFGDPIVLRGKVVEKTEYADINLAVVILNLVFGYGLVVDVQRAVAIGRDGSTSEDHDFIGSKLEVTATRRVHHGVAPEQEVFLVCSSTGRAVATLSDLRDTEATEEIMSVLRTEVTPQPES
jgi:hypothetical protein